MIVDCHTHVSFAGTEAETSAHIEAAQTVDACIVLAEAEEPCEKVNSKLAEYINKRLRGKPTPIDRRWSDMGYIRASPVGLEPLPGLLVFRFWRWRYSVVDRRNG